MTRQQPLTPVIIYNQGNPELWLCVLRGGAWIPVYETGPIKLPADWKQALIDWPTDRMNGGT